MFLTFGLLFFIAAIFLELLARIHYYIQQSQYPISKRIKLVFFGSGLINEGVDPNFMMNILSLASGKNVNEIQSLFFNGQKKYDLQYHLVPHIGFLPQPNQNLLHTMINSLGFRGPERVISKPHNVKRIILLGGSVCYGLGATSEANTISAQLEKLMNNDEQSEMQWEVINLAAPSIQSYQELFILLTYGLKYQPDIVISFSGINDSSHYYLHNQKINEHYQLSKVTKIYDLFSGGFFSYIKLTLYKLSNSFPQPFITIHYINLFLKKSKIVSAEIEDLSPFTYTIW